MLVALNQHYTDELARYFNLCGIECNEFYSEVFNTIDLTRIGKTAPIAIFAFPTIDPDIIRINKLFFEWLYAGFCPARQFYQSKFRRAITRAEGGDVFIYRPGGPCYCCLIGNGWYEAAREEITNEQSARRDGVITFQFHTVPPHYRRHLTRIGKTAPIAIFAFPTIDPDIIR